MRGPLPSAKARAYVTKMAIAQMSSTVTLERPSNPTFDSTTGKMTAGGSTLYWTGPARIYPTAGGMTQIGGAVVDQGQTTVAIPQDAPLPKEDDLVTVTATTDDSAMTGRKYRIIDVTEGGILSPTRNLTVTTVEGSPWS